MTNETGTQYVNGLTKETEHRGSVLSRKWLDVIDAKRANGETIAKIADILTLAGVVTKTGSPVTQPSLSLFMCKNGRRSNDKFKKRGGNSRVVKKARPRITMSVVPDTDATDSKSLLRAVMHSNLAENIKLAVIELLIK